MNKKLSNPKFIEECRKSCKYSMLNTGTGLWLKEALERLEAAIKPKEKGKRT
jgi:hypothetical protein